MSVATISPQQFAELLRSGQRLELIDVRTPVEFQEAHVEGARNVPLDALDPVQLMEARREPSSAPLYVICQSGARAQQACDRIRRAGYANVISVQGGTLACAAAAIPIVRGKGVISLERQVRIAAGLLVLLGVMLAVVVHEGFLGLAAFVGAGLLFAGLTDTCGMGLLLARMPWNRVGGSDRPGCCGAGHGDHGQ